MHIYLFGAAESEVFPWCIGLTHSENTLANWEALFEQNLGNNHAKCASPTTN